MSPSQPSTGESSTGETPTDPGSTSSDEPTTTIVTTTIGLDSSGGNLGPGQCALRCETSSECATVDAPASDWLCVGGFCQRIVVPECNPFLCSAMRMGVCTLVDGVNQCTVLCPAGGSECPRTEPACTRTDDLGNLICTPPPCGGAAEGEPCLAPGGGTLGTCIEQACTCLVDEECSAPGHACRH